jgi:hypothetical protein
MTLVTTVSNGIQTFFVVSTLLNQTNLLGELKC